MPYEAATCHWPALPVAYRPTREPERRCPPHYPWRCCLVCAALGREGGRERSNDEKGRRISKRKENRKRKGKNWKTQKEKWIISLITNWDLYLY
jgi:hypothetical protein